MKLLVLLVIVETEEVGAQFFEADASCARHCAAPICGNFLPHLPIADDVRLQAEKIGQADNPAGVFDCFG